MAVQVDSTGHLKHMLNMTHKTSGKVTPQGYLEQEDFNMEDELHHHLHHHKSRGDDEGSDEEVPGTVKPTPMDCSACTVKARPVDEEATTLKQCCYPTPSEVGACSPIIPESFRMALGAPMKVWQWKHRSGFRCANSHMAVKENSLCDPCRPLKYGATPFSKDMYCRATDGGSLQCYPRTRSDQQLKCNPVKRTDWYGGWDPFPEPLYVGGPPGCDKR